LLRTSLYPNEYAPRIGLLVRARGTPTQRYFFTSTTTRLSYAAPALWGITSAKDNIILDRFRTKSDTLHVLPADERPNHCRSRCCSRSCDLSIYWT